MYKNRQERVDGYNLFYETIKKGLEKNTSHYFFGNTDKVTNKMISKFCIKEIINIIQSKSKISKKIVYDYCLKLKNEK